MYVWDVSQTEGKELLKLDEATGDVTSQLPRLIEFVKQRCWACEYWRGIKRSRGI